jgi:hypothetical protein
MKKNVELMENIFYQDGSFRDIYIKDIQMSDWQLVLDFLKSLHHKIKFFKDGNDFDYLDFCAEEIFNLKNDFSIVMKICSDSMSINCHFFDSTEIEFDIDPHEITNVDSIEIIFNLIINLSKITQKRVVLTPENLSESPLVVCEPPEFIIKVIE